jgi:hypothetical protein
MGRSYLKFEERMNLFSKWGKLDAEKAIPPYEFEFY